MKYINKKRIPKYEINEMALMISPTIEDYFDDPKHQKEFEEWQRSRSTKQQKNVIPIKKRRELSAVQD